MSSNLLVKLLSKRSRKNENKEEIEDDSETVPASIKDYHGDITSGKSNSDIDEICDGMENLTIRNIPTIYDLYKREIPETYDELFSQLDYTIRTVSNAVIMKSNGSSWYPDIDDTFRAFKLCPLDKIKVVIYGQDPYHNGSACGLAFSGRRNEKIPRSLKTIFDELKRNYPDIQLNHPDLSDWAKQGVLLLNKCLTVNPGDAGSHKDIWDSFIIEVTKYICKMRPQTIFVLWGKEAQKMEPHIKNCKILSCGHPSPMAFHAKNPFKGCEHFLRINKRLRKMGEEEIDWSLT